MSFVGVIIGMKDLGEKTPFGPAKPFAPQPLSSNLTKHL